MRCPNCYGDIAPAPRCPRCDYPLQSAAGPAPVPPLQPSAQQRDHRAAPPVLGAQLPQLPFAAPIGPERVPLTQAQKTQLLFRAGGVTLPVMVMNCFLFIALRGLIRTFPHLVVIIGIGTLAVGYAAFQALRDLHLRVALVQVARLNRTGKSRRNGGKRVTYYADFEGLGQLHLADGLYGRVKPGDFFRVTYSPTTKIAWAAEPLTPDV